MTLTCAGVGFVGKFKLTGLGVYKVVHHEEGEMLIVFVGSKDLLNRWAKAIMVWRKLCGDRTWSETSARGVQCPRLRSLGTLCAA